MRFVISGLAVRCAAGCALSCVLVGAAVAQSNPAPSLSATASPVAPTLAQAVEAAWQRATQAREAEGQTQRATAERVAISSLWAAPPQWSFPTGTTAGKRRQDAGKPRPAWRGRCGCLGSAMHAALLWMPT